MCFSWYNFKEFPDWIPGFYRSLLSTPHACTQFSESLWARITRRQLKPCWTQYFTQLLDLGKGFRGVVCGAGSQYPSRGSATYGTTSSTIHSGKDLSNIRNSPWELFAAHGESCESLRATLQRCDACKDERVPVERKNHFLKFDTEISFTDLLFNCFQMVRKMINPLRNPPLVILKRLWKFGNLLEAP